MKSHGDYWAKFNTTNVAQYPGVSTPDDALGNLTAAGYTVVFAATDEAPVHVLTNANVFADMRVALVGVQSPPWIGYTS